MKLFLKIIFLFITFNFTIFSSFAMLPPGAYEEMIQESTVKAIATVKKVKILRKSDWATENKIIFKLENDVEKTNLPKEFTGYCKSKIKNQPHLIGGGTLYYNPLKHDRVFVTITKDGGNITSYTKLTPVLEEKIKKNYDEMKLGFGQIYF